MLRKKESDILPVPWADEVQVLVDQTDKRTR